jgi:hypothetical protein
VGEKKVTLRVVGLKVVSSAVLLHGILNIFGENTAERQKALEIVDERFERQGCVEFVGILRCAQDDGKNLNSDKCNGRSSCKDEQQVLRCAQDDNF